MKNVLILGAGMVSRPIVRYLLNQPDLFITLADMVASKAEKIIDNHEQGTAIFLDISQSDRLEEIVSHADIVVSLLPYAFHAKVARVCINHKKHLVTTSYIREEMRELDKRAKKAGILLLNECGLDPGIDHMSAMRVIHQIRKQGGKVTSFKSTTGALPAHEANTNPFGYKFSWSPRGVLLASRNPAKWLEEGKVISITGEQLFEHYYIEDVEKVGSFENYPNRNSIAYKDIYGLKDAETVYRGTFRMIGWCETLKAISQLGWLSEKPLNDFSGSTYADLTMKLIDESDKDNLYNQTASYLGLKPYASVMKRLEWLGLFEDKKLSSEKNTPLDHLNVVSLEKMVLQESERDMIVMHHEFIAEYEDRKEYITSTLLNYGIPGKDSAVSRTVSLPAAIAVKMIVDGIITTTGCVIPIDPEIYNPILDELETLDIIFMETREPYTKGQ